MLATIASLRIEIEGHSEDRIEDLQDIFNAPIVPKISAKEAHK
jgi:hypothetical protein